MPKKPSGLGRGLDAIFLENAQDESEKNGGITQLKLALIDPRSEQPRKSFDKEALQGLADSILQNGVIQPILVREFGVGRYQIIAGERRFRASKLAGLTEIPAIILDRDDKATSEIALIENIQREDLNPVEEALAYVSLAKEYGYTQEELAAKVGKSRSAVANFTRLLDLPEGVLDLVASGALSAGHARTLLGLKNPEDILPMANAAIAGDFSVRTLEEAVKKANRKKSAPKEEEPLPLVDYFRDLELRMEAHLGRRVKVSGTGKQKSVTIYYEDNSDLDALLTDICGKEFLEEN